MGGTKDAPFIEYAAEKANPATGDGFSTAVSAVVALSVLAGAAVVLGKKK